ncbi:unnamed protein product [Dibothriocephalus latus]|uniref:Uncharacterized protein n=1 Tax=Dibothriocephalus latus TaxID=60516 RepID=A0A3P7N8F9_DIBLA|nr:unnamed protein product [Dibothriocephalus latus]
MADKAKGTKVQRWERKIHLDWIDNVTGLMAGHDLGLLSPAKLRTDLRTLPADQHTVEEEVEVAAAAMMQWLAPISSSWRLHQREMMCKIDNLHLHYLPSLTFSRCSERLMRPIQILLLLLLLFILPLTTSVTE